MSERFLPFARPVVPNELTAAHPRIKEIKDTGYYVRTYGLSSEPGLSAQLLGEYKAGIKRWERLGSYSGINLPEFSPVIGATDMKNPSVFIVTEKIEGPNLEDISLSKDEAPVARDVFDTFMTGLINYSSDVYEERGEYLSDQDLSQYVYGRSVDGEKKVYFVDLGLECHVLPKDRLEQDENSHFFSVYMFKLFLMLERLEAKVEGPLINARSSFRDFLDSVPGDNGGAGYAKYIIDSIRQVHLSKI